MFLLDLGSSDSEHSNRDAIDQRRLFLSGILQTGRCSLSVTDIALVPDPKTIVADHR